LSVVVFGYRMTARPYSVMSFVGKTMIVKNVMGNLGEKHGPAKNELSNLKRNFLNIR
jgi:hypothetical protein